METIAYKISLNSGDLISCLPGIRQLWKQTGRKAVIYQTIDREVAHPYPEHPTKNENGKCVTMNMDTFLMMKPLLEAQEYIQSFEVYNGQEITFDLDKPREYNLSIIPYGPLHQYSSMIFPEMACDLSEPWIEVKDKEATIDVYTIPEMKWEDVEKVMYQTGYQIYRPESKIKKIIINRTERYNNPHINYFFLRKYEEHLLFVGTENEWDLFNDQWSINLPLLQVSDFLQLSQELKSCDFFIGNQSFCWHLADSIKTPRILEVCKEYPNSFPTGANGYSFLFQDALEYYIEKLFKK